MDLDGGDGFTIHSLIFHIINIHSLLAFTPLVFLSEIHQKT